MNKPLKSVAAIGDDAYLILCECTDDDHNLSVYFDVDDNLVTVYLKPSITHPRTIWEKLSIIWKLIWDDKVDFGHEIVLDKQGMTNVSKLFTAVAERMKDV